MKNFVENALKNSRNNSVKISVKSQMLKCGSEGGEAVCREELRNEKEKSLLSQYFSAKFLQLIHPSPFGFTLIELLVVMSIMVLLVAVSVPLLKPMFDSKKTKNAAEMVAAAFQRVRFKAMEEQTSCGIQFDRFTEKTEEGDVSNVSVRMRLIKSGKAYLNPTEVCAKVEVITINNPLKPNPDADEPITEIPTEDSDNATPGIQWRVSTIKLYRYNSETDKWVSSDDSSTEQTAWNNDRKTKEVKIQFGRQGRFYKLRNVKEKVADNKYKFHYTFDPPFNNLNLHEDNPDEVVEFKVLQPPRSSLSPPVVLPRGTVVDLAFSGGYEGTTYHDFKKVNTQDEDTQDKGIKLVFTPAGYVDKFYVDETEYKPYSGLTYLCIGEWERQVNVTYDKENEEYEFRTLSEDNKNNLETITNFWITLHPQTGQVRITEMAPIKTDTSGDWWEHVDADKLEPVLKEGRTLAAERYGISE
ncbi:MAG: prepilin-type N-terminal cleavage/methylation domain-containing protein [Planctomycetaceae bacterium]|jgi:prepilin-type N-terminal cleavage/methylation domain-containing protein|nr:prepilin-type N-terminal cleavage/methylation domain-containing protein [Planctomycetaceae bacterium]